MSARVPDVFDYEDEQENPDEDAIRSKSEVRCKHCRERDLFWKQQKGKWRLVDGEGRWHMCLKKSQPTADDFEVIDG